MKRVPTEIDRLMWAVAENPNPQAVIEFEMRYPDYRIEMLRRVEMVRGLRQEAKGPSFKSREIPRFEPRSIPPKGIPRGTTVAFGLAVAAIAIAGFTALHSAAPTRPKPVPQQDFAPVQPPSPPIVYNNGPQNQPPIPPEIPSSPPAPAIVPLEEKRRDLRLKDVDLVAALSLITSGTKLKLEIGPGFVNQKVTLDFHDQTTREMLVQMAKDYAFTVSDEGSGNFLVLPVPDDNLNAQTSTDSPRRIGP